LILGVNITIRSKQVHTELGKAFKEKLLGNLSSRFGLVEDIENSPCFGIETLLDPRFKKVAFTNIELFNKATSYVEDELASLIIKRTAADGN